MIRGKIDAPTSLADAKLRLQQLDHELKRIDAQITSADRVNRYPSKAEYNAWAKRAQVAQGLLGEERRQLADWITNSESSAEVLLEEAFAILCDLRESDDLEPAEIDVWRRIEGYFAKKNDNKHAVQ
jgi:hypothetical protein